MATGSVKAGYETSFFAIQSGANLNNFTTPGFYGVQNAATAANVTNSPVTAQGYAMMVLSKGAQAVQLVFIDTTIYVRQTTSGEFGAWRKISTEVIPS